MHIRVIYDEFGTVKGYTTLTNKREELLERLKRLNIPVETIQKLIIDGKEYNPKKLSER